MLTQLGGSTSGLTHSWSANVRSAGEHKFKCVVVQVYRTAGVQELWPLLRFSNYHHGALQDVWGPGLDSTSFEAVRASWQLYRRWRAGLIVASMASSK